MLLEVEKLNVFYGPIQALRDVSFRVEEGEIVSLIGANGAGKTTIMHSISGLLKIQSGSIRYKGQEIQSMPSHKILQNGLAQVPEGRRIFRQLSVEENLTIGAYIRTDKEKVQEDIEKSLQHFPILKERFKQQAGNLSGGEQQMLAIARALMSEPKLLLLDEPSMGLSPLLVQEIFRIIRTINETGTTVLLVEQNAQLALNISTRAYVLETGRVTMEGDSKQLLQDKRIQAAYLGA